jgi:hypothetical protein
MASHRFTKMVAVDLLSDWIYAVVMELHPTQVSFERDWENKVLIRVRLKGWNLDFQSIATMDSLKGS